MTLASTGQIYVTARAAREYGRALDVDPELARRDLTELLLEAGQRPSDGEYERWRRRTEIVEVSALVSREGPLAVVVTVDARKRS